MTQPGGIDWVSVQSALQRWCVGGSGLPATSVYWGQQDSPRVAEPAIELRVYNERGFSQPWLDREVNHLTVASRLVGFVDTALDRLTIVAHGLVTGDGPLRLTSSAVMPGGLTANTDYWAVVNSVDTFSLASTYFGTGGNFLGNPITIVDITSGGSGSLTLAGTTRTQRAGQEINYISRVMERCTLNIACHSRDGVGMSMAMALLHNIAARAALPTQRAILASANIGLEAIERVRALHGIRNALMFEPRALLEVYFSIPSEAVETGTIIQRVKGTSLAGKPFVAP